MTALATKRILIGGIGNVLLGDDGAGPYIVQLLMSRYEFKDNVEIVDLGTPALDLIDRISGKDQVILIDAIDAKATEAAPGTVVLYNKAAIMRQHPSVRMDPHSPALVDALLSAELFEVAPANLLLVGIVAESYDAGCILSRSVKASLDRVVAVVLHELDQFGVGYRLRERPTEFGAWWTVHEEANSPLAS